MAVEDHSLLFMIEFTTEATKFCAGRVEEGGWSDVLGVSGGDEADGRQVCCCWRL